MPYWRSLFPSSQGWPLLSWYRKYLTLPCLSFVIWIPYRGIKSVGNHFGAGDVYIKRSQRITPSCVRRIRVVPKFDKYVRVLVPTLVQKYITRPMIVIEWLQYLVNSGTLIRMLTVMMLLLTPGYGEDFGVLKILSMSQTYKLLILESGLERAYRGSISSVCWRIRSVCWSV